MSCPQLLHQLQTLQKEVATLRSLIRNQRIIERPRGLGSVEREVKRVQWEKDLLVLKRTNDAVQNMHGEIENTHKETLTSFRKHLALLRLKKKSKEFISLSERNEITYHSPDALKERLEELSGGVISISEEEIERMYNVHPNKITAEQKLHLKKMKEYSITEKGEGVESAPLVIVLPQKIVINKKEIPFSIRTLEDDLWSVLNASENLKLHMKEELKELYIDIYYVPGLNAINKRTGAVLENIRDKEWGSRLTAFTSTPIKGSYSKTYKEQKSLVRELFGSNSEIRADMYLSLLLHYLLTEELLIKFDTEGWMRLHEAGTDGDPLFVYYFDDGLEFDNRLELSGYDDTSAKDNAGIGSSFVFSLPSFAEASEGKPIT